METVETTFGTFRFVYGVGEATEGDFVGFAEEAGIDEGDPDRNVRTYKLNGEKYFTFVSDYIEQQRLSAGHIGLLKFQIPTLDQSIECEAVITSTSLQRTPPEGDEWLFEDDGSLKLIQKFTVTI